MLRSGCSFKQAALDLGHPLDQDEAERTTRRKDWQEIYRSEKNKFYAGVANDPTRSKSVAIGKMEVAIDRLFMAGEYDKVIAGIEKLGKLEGWIGADSSVNIFSGLTARDIAEARERLAGGARKVLSGKGLDPTGKAPETPAPTANGFNA